MLFLSILSVISLITPFVQDCSRKKEANITATKKVQRSILLSNVYVVVALVVVVCVSALLAEEGEEECISIMMLAMKKEAGCTS